jgi:transposase-like protein
MFVHPASVRKKALALVADGVNDCEISRRLAVPRTTVRDWRRPR